MKHPSWYYEIYKQVFEYNRNYNNEIMFLDKKYSFKNKKVIEIGAGTGNHAFEILKCYPSKLILIDYDDNAIAILKKRFNYPNVEIIYSDGFNRLLYGDIILCFFSIIQQTNIFSFFNRI